MEDLIDWIKEVNASEYSEALHQRGVMLAERFIKNKAVLFRIKRTVKKESRRLLLLQFKYLCNKAAIPSSKTLPVNLPMGEKTKYVEPWSELKISRVDWATLPEILQKKYFLKGRIFADVNQDFRLLRERNFRKDPRDLSLDEQKQNAELAFNIVAGFNEVQEIWEHIDRYLKKGILPPVENKKTAPLTIPDIRKKIKTKKNNINTYKKRMLSADNDLQKFRMNRKIKAYSEEIIRLENLLQKKVNDERKHAVRS